ncbi:MAG: redoxin domain-containing protein [Alphaproteobacteria bacterium]|nr:redoxin domain-containing protein [Alphaproteobacteria bacterium]
MSNLRSPFEKYFLLIGVVFTAIISYWVINIYNKHEFEKIKKETLPYFKEITKYPEATYLPLTRIADPKGDLIDISKHNTYTVLNVWATWCAPCLKELPALKRLNETLKYEDRWRIIAVSIDSKDNLEKVALFTKKLGVEDIANYHDINFELQKSINIDKLPMTLILNPSGKILYQIYGEAFWFDQQIIDFIRFIPKIH